MLHYVGQDVSVKSVSVCVVDGEGEVIARGETSSDPDAIASFLSEYAAEPERIVHESGILAIWRPGESEKRGLLVICIDARLAHKALSGRIRPTIGRWLRSLRQSIRNDGRTRE
ncbi:transposase [Phaeobacter inhibens]|uniref:Transposase n=1 Tax=Phaeobacter inhibens TaxID=221822 RepID=A0A2I7JT48_9RHOB|nr:transposase [Phaeobacter inhibens]AUQ93535.1 transposase [Phaeobacter inhibens]AUQ99985.1 transposase [Phaeobacter inhibens]AUR18838.1 transposase [Phaeobacter inhibens]